MSNHSVTRNRNVDIRKKTTYIILFFFFASYTMKDNLSINFSATGNIRKHVFVSCVKTNFHAKAILEIKCYTKSHQEEAPGGITVSMI